MTSSTDNYCVAGHPIAHSRSPQIHALFARQTGQQMRYERLLLPLDGFAAGVRAFRASGGRGMNVTLPFKEQVPALATQVSARVRFAGAANTLAFRGADLFADNTDGVGLVQDLQIRHRLALSGRAVVLLGAGGAARGVVQPLIEAGVDRLLIINRTESRAQALAGAAQALFATAGAVRACAWADIASAQAAWPAREWLLINASSASLSGQAPDLPATLLAGTLFAYDMMYSAQPTLFMQQAAQAGCPRIADGLGMLVEQAAESFLIWRGVRPLTEPVYRHLRDELARPAQAG